MARYYFDFVAGPKTTIDEKGVELDGIEAARREAITALSTLARDELPNGDGHECAAEVRDERDCCVVEARLFLALERLV